MDIVVVVIVVCNFKKTLFLSASWTAINSYISCNNLVAMCWVLIFRSSQFFWGHLKENDLLKQQLNRVTDLDDELSWMAPMKTSPIKDIPSINKGFLARTSPHTGLCFQNPYFHFHSRHFGPSVVANKIELDKYFRFV